MAPINHPPRPQAPPPPSLPISRWEGRARPYWAVLGHTGLGEAGRPPAPSISWEGPATPTTRHTLATPPCQAIGRCASLVPPPATLQLLIGLALLWVRPPPRAVCAVGQGCPAVGQGVPLLLGQGGQPWGGCLSPLQVGMGCKGSCPRGVWGISAPWDPVGGLWGAPAPLTREGSRPLWVHKGILYQSAPEQDVGLRGILSPSSPAVG